jgi:hypothetical protein
MAITTFVASQILTAAQMNAVQGNDYNQTVSTKTASYTLVAADKGTRIVMNVASANTVTVNTSLFSAGDTLMIQNIGAGVSTVTAGTATVSSAGPLAIPQNGSGLLYFTSAGVSIFYPSATTASALTLITRTTPSAAITLTFANIFSSTYDNYLIQFTNAFHSASNEQLFCRLGTSSTADTGSNYDGNISGVENGSAIATQSLNQSSWLIANSYLGNAQPSQLNMVLSSPNLARTTTFTSTYFGNRNTLLSSTIPSGALVTNTQYTDLFLFAPSGTIVGTLSVYGYANS